MKQLLILLVVIAIGNCQFGGFSPKLPTAGSPLNAAGKLAGGAADIAKSAAETFTKQFGDFKVIKIHN